MDLINGSWKSELEQRVSQLESLLASSGSQTAGASPTAAPASFTVMQQTIPLNFTQPSQQNSNSSDRQKFEVALNFTCSLGAFPAASMTDVKRAITPSASNSADLVSQGTLSMSTAQELFDYYRSSLDRYIYRILPEHDTLCAVRTRSPLLVAAICATAAFCQGLPESEACLKALTDCVSRKLFAKDHTFDDIRALCIGAFWLNDVSYALCSLAVRMASEVNLHRCITKMPHTDPKCYERTRLYFLVFICDHHCSLRHGRPPMTRTLRSLKNPRALLQSQYAVSLDVQLLAEVELWTLSGKVFNNFGADIGTPFDASRTVELERFGGYFDKWHDEWTQLLSLRGELDAVTDGLWDLHLNAAKLCLYSHVFRGSTGWTANSNSSPDTSSTMSTSGPATQATDAALGYLHSLTSWRDPQCLPSYFSTMAAFASVFLLRACSRGTATEQPAQPNLTLDKILSTLHSLSKSLHQTLDISHATHPLLAVANGLDVAVGGRLPTSQAPAPVPATSSDQAQSSSHRKIYAPLVPAPSLDVAPNLDSDLTALGDQLLGSNFPLDMDMGWMTLPMAHDMGAAAAGERGAGCSDGICPEFDAMGCGLWDVGAAVG
ncbi:uncharacterized protein HMPREF1541_04335 [Cyphellophora europaea CBS 101466]|uniref:Xylanolytic transcriptional activator regulatory domain-containing protein n=1 Tax=Cyphellophora europaea (strain CBS 101466) TaxID=1220924 RepID=W2RUS9_CYPE1|nr:uncharacterized protein HMPREF1541_04335 [Cyphellophora europaea CBS 101466]ETN40060.1 hypothetical protein HMPREF1541_04335 [Cyphellophora europaea CBS 101466]